MSKVIPATYEVLQNATRLVQMNVMARFPLVTCEIAGAMRRIESALSVLPPWPDTDDPEAIREAREAEHKLSRLRLTRVEFLTTVLGDGARDDIVEFLNGVPADPTSPWRRGYEFPITLTGAQAPTLKGVMWFSTLFTWGGASLWTCGPDHLRDWIDGQRGRGRENVTGWIIAATEEDAARHLGLNFHAPRPGYTISELPMPHERHKTWAQYHLNVIGGMREELE